MSEWYKIDPQQVVTLWDNGDTTWDDRATVWDLELVHPDLWTKQHE